MTILNKDRVMSGVKSTDDKFKMTAPENFAWRNCKTAMKFANDLTSVIVGQEPNSTNQSDYLFKDAQRINQVLDTLTNCSPVKIATLWKLKGRARHASVIGRSSAYDEMLDPSKAADITEFVCPWDQSHIGLIVNEAFDVETENWNDVIINDVKNWRLYELPVDHHFNTPERISVLKLKRCISILFGSICSPGESVEVVPNFLLNLYFSDYEDEEHLNIPAEILESVKAKIESGVCALIDRRLTRITREISKVEMSEAGAGADYAIKASLEKVLPKFIWCEKILRVVPLNDGNWKIAMNSQIHTSERCLDDNADLAIFNNFEANELGELILAAIEDDERDEKVKNTQDTFVVRKKHIRQFLKSPIFSDVNSLMIGRIQERTAPSNSRGYVICINRLNDCAIRKKNDARIADYFDWEDEIYLDQICNTLDFIAELFIAEEARLNRAHVLSHELHTPTEFIYATVERLQDWVSNPRAMPTGMVSKEIEDILVTSDLQSALIDNLMLGLDTSSAPPSKRYSPEWVNFQQVVDEIIRMARPICRKHKVPHAKIKARHFYQFFIDSRAANQIFLNIITNAIKYSKPGLPNNFSLNIYSERINLDELKTMRVSEDFMFRMEMLNVSNGTVIFFEDRGIGILEKDVERIFNAGVRSDVPEVTSKIGAGIGLSVVKSIVNDHFGDVWVERTANPTTICIFLPDIVRDSSYIELPEWQGR